MGLDLTLIPLYWGNHRNEPDPVLSDSLMSQALGVTEEYRGYLGCGEIRLERRSELFAEIQRLGQPMDAPVWCHHARRPDGEKEYGLLAKDPYGDPLAMVRVRDLLPLAEHDEVQDAFLNRAAWAWLAAMPPDAPLVLYWN